MRPGCVSSARSGSTACGQFQAIGRRRQAMFSVTIGRVGPSPRCAEAHPMMVASRFAESMSSGRRAFIGCASAHRTMPRKQRRLLNIQSAATARSITAKAPWGHVSTDELRVDLQPKLPRLAQGRLPSVTPRSGLERADPFAWPRPITLAGSFLPRSRLVRGCGGGSSIRGAGASPGCGPLELAGGGRLALVLSSLGVQAVAVFERRLVSRLRTFRCCGVGHLGWT